MKKLLTAGIFGTLLTITGGADASIVSRGFFEEQIGNYATLDLLNSKANQKDLTALNDIVGKEDWNNIVLNLKFKDFPHLSELFPDLAPDKIMPFADISNYIYGNLTYIGAPNLASVTDKFLYGWTNSDNLTRQGLIALNDGWTDKNDGTTYLGLKDINTKIGTLPSGATLNNLLESFNPLESKPFLEHNTKLTSYPKSLEELIYALYGSQTYPGFIEYVLATFESHTFYYEKQLNGENGLSQKMSSVINKIGTIDSENTIAGYDNLADALREINAKVDNKITNLSATASNGKYVLTAVKEGDQTTYAWESIDRSESETTTTE